MKKKIFLVLSFLCVLFFSTIVMADIEDGEMGNCFWCGFYAAHPTYAKYVEIENKIYPIFYAVTPWLVGIFSILAVITAIKMKGKVKIIYKENGKIVKKYVKLIPSDTTEIIFEDKNNRYECTAKDIVKIQKRNSGFYAFVMFIPVLGLLSFIDHLTKNYYFHNKLRIFELAPLIFLVLLIYSIFNLISKWKKVRITFKEGGKVIKKYVKLISYVEKKIIFEDKTNRYECTPDEVIKIQTINKSFIALLIVLSLIGLFQLQSDIAWSIVDDGIMYD